MPGKTVDRRTLSSLVDGWTKNRDKYTRPSDITAKKKEKKKKPSAKNEYLSVCIRRTYVA